MFLEAIFLPTFQIKTIRCSVPEDVVLESAAAVQSSTGSSAQLATTANSTQPHRTPVRELLELVYPCVNVTSLKHALPVPRTEELLIKLDEQSVSRRTV